ncbi:type VI secretion system contractile sheath large subunit [Aquincola sp. S2]|uniref:Type VI secretion system contractile sheath large subunit n=1 Tax=Pseudaquabacterium terrae TaxID=2732868 RepID=A0ABX2EE95_9BURK|nr:type VI secretion system contractile sheath large subunit [Aquabacterium terrae]NRF66926.1 type VI secretion system contractile sheath large subunit [Aquabacterium terrae]
MSHSFNFGRFSAGRPAPRRSGGRFRIALLGDFSGRAHRGELRRGDALAATKPLKLDVDTLDRLLAGFGSVLRLPIDGAGDTVELKPRSLDDLHPDALYDSLPLFNGLVSLRQRLAQPSTFAAAAAEVRQWGDVSAAETSSGVDANVPARGDTLPIDARMNDFARLLGREAPPPAPPGPLDAMLRRIVAPHLVEAAAPDAPALTAAVDRALTQAMRRVLHHPDFQCLEAAWRTLDFAVRRIETDNAVQLVAYDISAEEFAADLSATDRLEDTALYKLLVEQPPLDAHQGALSALIGCYGFEMTPPQAELLGRAAQIAAAAHAPFIAGLGRDCIDAAAGDLHPRIAEAWAALRALPAARFVSLVTPRVLLRAPYGKRSDPITRFAFEEFDPRAGLQTLLWGNPALVAAVLLAQQVNEHGAHHPPLAQYGLDELPYFFHYDEDGQAVALPCTERLLTERHVAALQGIGVVPLLAHKGQPEVRLGGFVSLAGGALAGPWGGDAPLVEAPVAASAPESSAADDAELDALLDELGERRRAGGRAQLDFSVLLKDLRKP